MDVVFSGDSRKDILHIPIPPSELEISFPHNNMTINTAIGGQLKLIGQPGLKGISFESWAPIRAIYPFVKSNVLAPQLKEFFVKYKRKRQPIRIVITNKDGYELHNERYGIDNFTFGYDRVGDMPFKLSLESLGDK